jgi:hypothetical protein
MSPHNLIPCLFPLCQYDQDYYPGRRKRGKDYREDMVCSLALECSVHTFLNLFSYVVDLLFALMQHELPFYYPGQVMFDHFYCSFSFQQV